MPRGVTIDLARKDEEGKITNFLRRYWSADHIFIKHPELLRWQHTLPCGDNVHLAFMLAQSLADGEDGVLGLLGFMPFRRFDPASNWSEMALAIWRVREDAAVPGLGVMLHNKLLQQIKPELVCAIGLSEMVRPIYSALGYMLGELSHAALFHPGMKGTTRLAKAVPLAAYQVADLDSEIEWRAIIGRSIEVEFVREQIDALGAAGLPRKSAAYIENRYLRHPWHRYAVRLVIKGQTVRAVVVWRRVDTALASILRIVDIIGDAEIIARCGAALRDEVVCSGCEYVDVMYYGLAPEAVRSAGFVALGDYPDLVLPNYFSPFVHANVRVNLAFKCRDRLVAGKVRLYRADADQDRPNDPAVLTDDRAHVS